MAPSSPWVVQSPAERRAPGDADVLVAIPPAGAGASYFAGWGHALPSRLELWPVELPGRNTRSREPKPTADLHTLAASLADGLAPLLAGSGRRFGLFGHSMGAWLAFELALELRARGCGEPVKLYVSSNRAPSLAGAQHDPDPRGAQISNLPPEQFWPRFEERYGVNPDLASPGVRAFLLPLLVADFACIEAYRGPSPGTPCRLECPITAIGCGGDCRFRPEQLSAWKQHTSGPFEERWFTAPSKHTWSTPHRFLADDPSAFQAWLSADWELLVGAHGRQAAPSE